jgi:hypothetical protein
MAPVSAGILTAYKVINGLFLNDDSIDRLSLRSPPAP